MEAKELRIGNFVTYDNKHNIPIEIRGLHTEGVDTGYRKLLNYDQIFPIPLTEEWLLKFGFKIERWKRIGHLDKIEIIEGYVFDNIWCFIPYKHNRLRFFGRRVLRDVEKDLWIFEGREGCHVYVHQFQNLMFALTCEEITIKDCL